MGGGELGERATERLSGSEVERGLRSLTITHSSLPDSEV